MKAAIAGAGIAGLAAGIALRQAGCEVEIENGFARGIYDGVVPALTNWLYPRTLDWILG